MWGEEERWIGKNFRDERMEGGEYCIFNWKRVGLGMKKLGFI